MTPQVETRWFDKPEGVETRKSLFEATTAVIDAERPRLQEMARLVTLFEEKRGLFGSSGLRVPRQLARLPRNVMRAIVRTAQSRILATRARPFFCSDGGDFDLRQRLEQLNEAVSGLFLATDADQAMSLVCLHAALLGAGAVRVYANNGRPALDRVYPWEIYVDPLDGLYGAPRTLYLVRWVDRSVLLARYPRRKREIQESSTDRIEWAGWTRTLGEPIRVVEAWHLGEGDQPGRHVIAIDKCTLRDEPFKASRFPVVIFRWSDAIAGYWPPGLGHDLYGPQLEVNRLADMIRDIVHRCAAPRLVVDDSSAVPSAVLDNVIGAIVRVRHGAQAPQYVTGQGLTLETRQALLDQVAWMYESSGVSQSMASATKPPGITSGRAYRMAAEREDGRLMDPVEKWQAASVDLGEALVDCMREIAERDPEAAITFTDPKKRAVKRVVWADVDVPDAELRMICGPISVLPSTPGAKAQALEEMFNAKALTLEEYREAIDLPDLDALQGPAKAPRRYIEKCLDAMIRDGVPAQPEPFLPLQLAVQLGAQRYCQAEIDGAPEDRLELVRQWIADCTDLMTPPDAAGAPANDSAPLTPQAPPANDAGGAAPAPMEMTG